MGRVVEDEPFKVGRWGLPHPPLSHRPAPYTPTPNLSFSSPLWESRLGGGLLPAPLTSLSELPTKALRGLQREGLGEPDTVGPGSPQPGLGKASAHPVQAGMCLTPQRPHHIRTESKAQ